MKIYLISVIYISKMIDLYTIYKVLLVSNLHLILFLHKTCRYIFKNYPTNRLGNQMAINEAYTAIWRFSKEKKQDCHGNNFKILFYRKNIWISWWIYLDLSYFISFVEFILILLILVYLKLFLIYLDHFDFSSTEITKGLQHKELNIVQSFVIVRI